jgi:hypothetical protein
MLARMMLWLLLAASLFVIAYAIYRHRRWDK